MSLVKNLREMEQKREAYWLRYPATSPIKLRWRAVTVRHCFHVRPGEKILELGAGGGLWTEHLTNVFRGENPITAAVFNDDLLSRASEKNLPNTEFVRVSEQLDELPKEQFDYVIGTAIICHRRYPENLGAIYDLLKPGGELLFFEANHWNPQVFVKDAIPPVGRWSGNAGCQIGMRRYKLMQIASREGFTNIEIIPYDIVHPRTPRMLIRAVQSSAFVFEQTPIVRDLCGTLYIWAKKPGETSVPRPPVSLTEHEVLKDAVSFVVPSHNEEMNIPRLVDSIVELFDSYVHEIVIVNDNSCDRTAEVTQNVAAREPRVKLINRKPPNGVGRALRDGYAAATGRYILTMDCDFVQILPEIRDLFDVVAAGHDGAIGSRFSHESILINYPFFKIVCNRGFHLLANLFLPGRFRDISNNLKVYRSEILKNLDIEENHFAANVETGLKPLLAGYDIREVPIAWINRSSDMGASSFRIVKVAPDYFKTLCRLVVSTWRHGRRKSRVRQTANTETTIPARSNVLMVEDTDRHESRQARD